MIVGANLNNFFLLCIHFGYVSESTNQMKYLILGKPRFGVTNVIVTLFQTLVRRSFTETAECLVKRDYYKPELLHVFG